MKFDVGPWEYIVRIADEPMAGSSGDELVGMARFAAREILLSPTLDARGRLEILTRELQACWRHHFGKPGAAKGEIMQLTSFTVDFMRQLDVQGGEMALMLMTAKGDGCIGPKMVRPRVGRRI